MSSISLQALASHLGAKLVGDPQCAITGLATLEHAKAGELSFLSNQAYRQYLSETKASAVILQEPDVADCPVAALVIDNPRLALAKAASLFKQAKEKVREPGIHATAVIGAGCHIPPSVSIAAYCVVGEEVTLGEQVVVGEGTIIGNHCKIGAHTVLKPRVVLQDFVTVGAHCTIHSGAVIGGDGFGYAYDEGQWVKMPHLAGVTIEDFVEVGSNTTIDRGFLEDTRIGKGVIIDNLVLIGHNVVIGAGSALAGFVGIAGSTTIGKNCMIGGNASIAGHITLADNVHLTATAAVHQSIQTPGVYSSGIPTKPNAIWRRNAVRFQYLDEMAKRLRTLETKVEHLAESNEGMKKNDEH